MGCKEYRILLDRALLDLQRFPKLGCPRDEISTGLRSFPAGSHLIFYRYQGDTVTINRIVHERRDVEAHDFDEFPLDVSLT